MRAVPTTTLSARLTDQERAEIDTVAKERGITSAAALRIGATLLVEQHQVGSPLPVTKSDQEVMREWRGDFEVFRDLVDATLEAEPFGFTNVDHRRQIAAEVAADRSLVSVIARMRALDVDTGELLSAVLSEWLAANPGAEFAELPRTDLAWLALNFGDRPSIPQQHVSYIVAEVDRACVVDRWRMHRRYIGAMAARGVDYKQLFHHCPNYHGPKLIAPAQLRSFSFGGQLEWEIGAPPDAPPPQPVMTEIEGVIAGTRSAKIGSPPLPNTGTGPAARRNKIGNGDFTP